MDDLWEFGPVPHFFHCHSGSDLAEFERAPRSPFRGVSLMVERGIDFCLVLLLLIVLASLVIFPVRLSKNMAIHSVLYSIYFMSLLDGHLYRQCGRPAPVLDHEL